MVSDPTEQIPDQLTAMWLQIRQECIAKALHMPQMPGHFPLTQAGCEAATQWLKDQRLFDRFMSIGDMGSADGYTLVAYANSMHCKTGQEQLATIHRDPGMCSGTIVPPKTKMSGQPHS